MIDPFTRKVAAAVIPAYVFRPTPRMMLGMLGCWVLARPYTVPGYFLEAKVLIRPDAEVKFEIAEMTAEVHR